MQKGLYYVKVCFKRLFSLILSFCYVFCCCGFLYGFGVEEGAISKSAPKLSVVVPVYNVAPYLDEALDSVENQTYKDMEVICVNDGSTDNSPEILERHAKKDKRIKIITQENQGLSEARNVGLRAAVGDYVYFFDSDDVLAPYAMEKAIKNLEKYHADTSEFDHTSFNYKNHADLKKYTYKEKAVKVIECNGTVENPLEKFGCWPVMVWCRLYRRSFLIDNNLYFKKGLRTNEDVLFNYCMKASMRKMVKDNNIGYFYRGGRPGSIMNTDYKIINKRVDARLIMVHELGLNKDRFKFPGGKEYVLRLMLNLTYRIIRGLKNKADKSFYAGKAYKEIQAGFVDKYGVKVNEDGKKKLDDLKKWSEGDFSEQKPETKKDKKQGKKIKNKEKRLKKGKNQGNKAKKSTVKAKGKVNRKNKK